MESRRKKPKDGDYYGWHSFEKWATANGVETPEEDWFPWWQCWKAGFNCAMNQQ